MTEASGEEPLLLLNKLPKPLEDVAGGLAPKLMLIGTKLGIHGAERGRNLSPQQIAVRWVQGHSQNSRQLLQLKPRGLCVDLAKHLQWRWTMTLTTRRLLQPPSAG
jgi:hypothetical protein